MTWVSWLTSSQSRCCPPAWHSAWSRQSWCSTRPSPGPPRIFAPSSHRAGDLNSRRGHTQLNTGQEIERLDKLLSWLLHNFQTKQFLGFSTIWTFDKNSLESSHYSLTVFTHTYLLSLVRNLDAFYLLWYLGTRMNAMVMHELANQQLIKKFCIITPKSIK